jgi:CHASE2 domain-containing sensor protein
MLTAYFSGMAIVAYLISRGVEARRESRRPVHHIPAMAIAIFLAAWPLTLAIGTGRWLLERGK